MKRVDSHFNHVMKSVDSESCYEELTVTLTLDIRRELILILNRVMRGVESYSEASCEVRTLYM